jgi:hypothetical protein
MEQTLVHAMEHWLEAKLGCELDYPMERALVVMERKLVGEMEHWLEKKLE